MGDDPQLNRLLKAMFFIAIVVAVLCVIAGVEPICTQEKLFNGMCP